MPIKLVAPIIKSATAATKKTELALEDSSSEEDIPARKGNKKATAVAKPEKGKKKVAAAASTPEKSKKKTAAAVSSKRKRIEETEAEQEG
ncbi:hypothetical protein C8A01DRAFT_41871 [Parachaetomium inaequale]|uniref:Uncharacterized protein n=1 Tax=Parachaetomium inaequale TaxID=2588326 RepID=A0AAN6SLN9_9PEZI|nr:hypothetical protein C8A01DRAFT_41871 [Parachaetomium inaequale]